MLRWHRPWESLSVLAPPVLNRTRTLSGHLADKRLCQARTCYDHLAGRLGVALTAQWVKIDWLRAGEYEYTVTDQAVKWLDAHQIGTTDILNGRRPAARMCLDWSERKPHVAGAFGAALTDWLLRERWLVRVPSNRTVRVTERGQAGFLHEFGLDMRLVLAQSATELR